MIIQIDRFQLDRDKYSDVDYIAIFIAGMKE